MTDRQVIYLVAAAAPPVLQVSEACQALAREGWEPCVILTPSAATWVSASDIAVMTGYPVRVHPRLPGEEDPLLPAAAVLAAPLTFNSVNKWAAGISDNLALGLLNELISAGIPVSAVPCVKETLQHHPAYVASLALLRRCAVKVLDQDHFTGRTPAGLAAFDWTAIVETLR